MALVAFEGFDQYSSTVANDLLNHRGGAMQWSSASAQFVSPDRNTASGRYALLGGGANMTAILTTPLQNGFVGFAMYVPYVATFIGSISINLIDSHASGATQISLRVSQVRNGLDVYNGSNTLIAQSANNSVTFNAWNYIEINAVMADVGGVTVRCNGQTIISQGSIRTQVTANAWFDGVFFGIGSGATNSTVGIDDFYVADTTTGPGIFPFNTFAGDVRVVTRNPVGNGDTIQWTPLSGSNYAQVNELANNGDASYNSTATAGLTDLFYFSALAGTITTVLAVQVVGSYRKDDAGTRMITQYIKSSGTASAGSAQSIPNSYVYVSDIWPVDPATGQQWSIAAVNGLQAGYTLSV